jgi:hypothetical protein
VAGIQFVAGGVDVTSIDFNAGHAQRKFVGYLYFLYIRTGKGLCINRSSVVPSRVPATQVLADRSLSVGRYYRRNRVNVDILSAFGRQELLVTWRQYWKPPPSGSRATILVHLEARSYDSPYSCRGRTTRRFRR